MNKPKTINIEPFYIGVNSIRYSSGSFILEMGTDKYKIKARMPRDCMIDILNEMKKVLAHEEKKVAELRESFQL